MSATPEVVSSSIPRVAYFPDAFPEINGVAHTSRQFQAFGRRQNLPFLCVRAGPAGRMANHGSVRTLELPRSAFSFPVEKDLRFDLAYWRHLPRILAGTRRFRPDIIHITGPSELGLLGAWIAHHLRVPLVASWHTNVHEYAATRSAWFTRLFGKRGPHLSRQIESSTLWRPRATTAAPACFSPPMPRSAHCSSARPAGPAIE